MWGLTSGIDAWMKEKTGIDPSKVGGGEIDKEAALADVLARQAEIDARLKQIDQSMHPAMQNMANPARDALVMQRNMLDADAMALSLQGDGAAGSAAADVTMGGFNQTMQAKADEARAIMAKLMADMQTMASTIMAPTIRPKLDMSGISGVHADIGVE